MKVYQAINRVQSELASIGITKDKRNAAQGFNFRGIDDVYNALSPLLARHGLCILPRMLTRHCDERINAKGTTLFYVTVEAEFDFVAAEDGSKHVVRTFGEAMDSGDKATNKAMSAAYKYAAFQAFAIPTEGDNDADAHTHVVAPRTRAPEPVPPMPDKVKADFLASISSAGSMEELKHAYTAAYQAAAQLADVQAEFTRAKDQRKNILIADSVPA